MNTTTALEERRAAAEVWPLANELITWLTPTCERVTVGGSLRRGRESVKDVELIVLNPTPAFYAELDAAVERGAIAKKRYGEKQTARWGDKYRGIVYQGVTFELFCCDADNAGYVTVLRTGPAEANQYLVTQLKYRSPTWHLKDGYCWATYTSLELPSRKLHVPTEADFFALCGLPFIEPADRSEALYRKLLSAKGHVWGDPAAYLADDTPAAQTEVQGALFDAPEAVPAGGRDEAAGKAPASPDTLWTMAYSAERRRADSGLRELIDQLTHGATQVALEFDGQRWHAERIDADGIAGWAEGATLMDALNRAIPTYRRARAAADEKAG